MLKQRYPNTDEDSLKAYVKMILKNEEVLQILEGSKGEEKEEK
jgi:hypothetical protein